MLRALDHILGTACALVMIAVFVMWLTGMEPHEFWRW